jgi:hypothetical protein
MRHTQSKSDRPLNHAILHRDLKYLDLRGYLIDGMRLLLNLIPTTFFATMNEKKGYGMGGKDSKFQYYS